eukprot:s8554_g2.t1
MLGSAFAFLVAFAHASACSLLVARRSRFGSFLLPLLMAVRPRLDDPAALTALLDQLGAPAAVRSALSSLAFALADPSDPAQVKLFLKSLLGLPDDDDSGFVSRPLGTSAASAKLQPADFAHLKKEFTAKYQSTPSLEFLSLLKQHGESAAPWLAPPHLRGRRRPWNDRDSESEPPAPSVNVNMQGPVEPVVRRALHLFATALAMLDLVHLATIKKFSERFLDLALHPPIDSTLRPPSLQEILQADRAAKAPVQSVTRTTLPPPTRPPSKAAAKAKVAAGKAKAAPNPPPKGWDASWCKTIGDKEACVRFAVGKCTKTDCKFVHGCPVPLPNGKACGQPHTALEHGKTPH